MEKQTNPEAAYIEEHLRYRKLLGMGCDVMLTREQAQEVAKLLGTAHVAMQQNAMLREESCYWQRRHVDALNKCSQLTHMLEQVNELNRGLQKENEDYCKRMGMCEQGTGEETAGERAD